MKFAVFCKSFLTFVFTIVILELFLRWSGTSIPALVIDDENLGRILRSDTDVILTNEGFYMGRVNHGGYLGPYYPETKPDGCIRIAVIGDSYVAGFQLFDRYHFRSVLEQRLRETLPDSIQVLNFGFAGFNLQRMYIYDKLRIRRYNPDIVVFFIGMDDLYEQDPKLGPQCVFRDSELMLDFGFRDTKAYRLTKKFRYLRQTAFYSLNKKSLEMYAAGKTPEIVFDKVYKLFKSEKSVAANDSLIILTPEQTALAEAIFTDLAREKHPRIIFAVKNHLSDETQNFIRSQQLSLYDLTVALDSLRDDGIDPNYWKATSRSGHWNHHAHRVIGQYLASVVVAKFVN